MAEGDNLLEIYKLHSELTDNVSERRQSANRIYAGILGAVLVLAGGFLRFASTDDSNIEFILVATGLVLVFVSISWCITILGFRQLNRIKFIVLHELEESLPYQFYVAEWRHERKVRLYKLYRTAEFIMPIMFTLLGAAIMVWVFCYR